MQTDPVKGASPWGRGVVRGAQILICPQCQRDDPEWMQRLSRCPRCGSPRLSIVLGSIVCRRCGHDWEPGPDDRR